MHARKTARDAWFSSREDDAFFSPRRGDIVFPDTAAARRFAEKVKAEHQLRPAELAAMVLVHEIFHAVMTIYREQHPSSFERLRLSLDNNVNRTDTLLAFLKAFPPPVVYRGEESAEKMLAREGKPLEEELTEEVLLLWLVNQNPAYEPVRPIVTDRDLPPSYLHFISESNRFFAQEPKFGPRGETLMELLLAPSRENPHSIFAQLAFIEEEWGRALGLDRLPLWRRILWARDFAAEEGKWFFKSGPGPGAPLLDPMTFGRHVEDEPKRFSEDLDWMPRVVLIAKTVYVWLDQLSKKYQRHIHRLDQVPDEELDLLASRGFTGLWLIGLFERSRASAKIKRMRGDQDAVASAYSLKSYTIAEELGGYSAYENLRSRAWSKGIRLAADMVPNHVGIDGDWVINHPHWFLQSPHPPFPSYRFGGTDLSEDGRVGIFIEEGYWNHTDAAVVFRRHDRHTGEDRFIYHGNDGTSMPWNDTAQLDYTKVEVRQAVIETILHVARMFPIIRFDAAMTLAKRHYKRLWFPHPGAGDGIPSRADHAMSQEEFDRVFPVEFWREVVDTVAQRAPDTLLLAEAFWMMEGYFVRSLGMHRVYNSAFMNMLKREENAKYRATIRNVLDFDPEILKRFVNFMNNPDEETAVAQFGSDDKYFGVCMLMATMPGLPMFGHGQIEGFHEKYGMEYRRAKWDEQPNQGLIERHEREIFPLLKKRWLFSGVTDFALYDFIADGGGVDEDVFAYSNRAGDARALVLYNNKFKTTRGRVQASTHRGSVAHELGIDPSRGDWLVFRDEAKGLEYVRNAHDVASGGMWWHLDAFKYHVLLDFREVHATQEAPYDKLAAELGDRGVPSIAEALVELRFRPVHVPLRAACSAGHLAYLVEGWDAKTSATKKEALVAFEERLGHFADGLAWLLQGTSIDREGILARAITRFTAVLETANAPVPEDAPVSSRSLAADAATEDTGGNGHPSKKEERDEVDVHLLLAWVEVEAMLDMIDEAVDAGRGKKRGEEIDAWRLGPALAQALAEGTSEYEGRRRAALVLLMTALPAGTLPEIMHAALKDPRGRAYLGVHESGGVQWLVKERFEELATAIAEREAVKGVSALDKARSKASELAATAEREGFKAEAIAAALEPKPKPATSPSARAVVK